MSRFDDNPLEIFCLLNAVVLKTLPVSHLEELVQVTMGSPWYCNNPTWEAGGYQ